MSKILDGFKIGFGIFLFFSILFGIAWASGWHTAEEIFGGTFEIGSYSFAGSSVNFTDATIYGLSSSGGIDISNDQTCNSGNEGMVNYDADENESTLQYCNGIRWIILSNSPKLPISCKEILDQGGSIGDGIYTIDPDGIGGVDSFNVYCDMTNLGGGWTLVANHGSNVVRTFVDLVNITNYGIMSDEKWIAVRNTMEIGMMFIDQDNKVSALYKNTLNSARCITINDTITLKPIYSIWHDDNGCDYSGTDYSFVYLRENVAASSSLYQWSPLKFDVWPYAGNNADPTQLLYFVK